MKTAPVETAIAGTVETCTRFAVQGLSAHCQAHGLQLGHALHLGFKLNSYILGPCFKNYTSFYKCKILYASLYLVHSSGIAESEGPKT